MDARGLAVFAVRCTAAWGNTVDLSVDREGKNPDNAQPLIYNVLLIGGETKQTCKRAFCHGSTAAFLPHAWLLATFAFFFFSFFPSSIDMRREVSWLGGAKLLDETNILFAILIEWIKFVDDVDRCGIR